MEYGVKIYVVVQIVVWGVKNEKKTHFDPEDGGGGGLPYINDGGAGPTFKGKKLWIGTA